MSSAVMLSIRPEWCELIASGEKTVEVRKTRPKIPTPFKCYIYCTQFKYGEILCFPQYKTGKVIGEFVCDDIHAYPQGTIPTDFALSDMRMKGSQFHKYRGDGTAYGWLISELDIYEKPMELSEFVRVGWQETFDEWEHYSIAGVYTGPNPNVDDWRITSPPQSWCYVEEI